MFSEDSELTITPEQLERMLDGYRDQYGEWEPPFQNLQTEEADPLLPLRPLGRLLREEDWIREHGSIAVRRQLRKERRAAYRGYLKRFRTQIKGIHAERARLGSRPLSEVYAEAAETEVLLLKMRAALVLHSLWLPQAGEMAAQAFEQLRAMFPAPSPATV